MQNIFDEFGMPQGLFLKLYFLTYLYFKFTSFKDIISLQLVKIANSCYQTSEIICKSSL